jgi:hypothetical protein
MRMKWLAVLAVFAFAPILLGQSGVSTRSVNGGAYVNSSLGLTITLSGPWEIKETDHQPSAKPKVVPGCQGPLCGDPEINVSLLSKPGTAQVGALFLAAWKVDPGRYKLRNIAELMTKGSMGPEWTAVGNLTPTQLDGRPAYRLIAHRLVGPGYDQRAFSYAVIVNGYALMILSTSGPAPESATLMQSMVESLKFSVR